MNSRRHNPITVALVTAAACFTVSFILALITAPAQRLVMQEFSGHVNFAERCACSAGESPAKGGALAPASAAEAPDFSAIENARRECGPRDPFSPPLPLIFTAIDQPALTVAERVSVPKAIPAVTSHDSRGRYVIPKCPICGDETVLSCTTYRCASGHKFETEDIDLINTRNPELGTK